MLQAFYDLGGTATVDGGAKSFPVRRFGLCEGLNLKRLLIKKKLCQLRVRTGQRYTLLSFGIDTSGADLALGNAGQRERQEPRSPLQGLGQGQTRPDERTPFSSTSPQAVGNREARLQLGCLFVWSAAQHWKVVRANAITHWSDE